MINEATFNYLDLQSIVGSAASHVPQTIHIVGVSTDTRSLVPGNAFIALSGEQFDGHDHVSTAIEKGAPVEDHGLTSAAPSAPSRTCQPSAASSSRI